MNDPKFTYRFRRTLQQAFDSLQKRTVWRQTLQATIVLLSIVATSFMFPSVQSFQFSNLKDGDVYTGQEIIAPFTFYINKSDDEVNRDRKASSEKIPLVFVKADTVERLSLRKFDELFQAFSLVQELAVPDSIKSRRIRDILDSESIVIEEGHLKYLFSVPVLDLPNTKAKKVEDVNGSGSMERFKQHLRIIVLDVQAIGLLDMNMSNIPIYIDKLSVISDKGEILENVERFYKLDNYREVVLQKLRQTFSQNEVAVKIGYPIVTGFLTPNLLLDELETEKRINEAVASVALSKGIVLENERIVNTHELITPQILEKLNSLATAKSEREASEGGTKLILPYIGRLLTITLAFSFMLLFLLVERKEIATSLKKLLMIFIIFLFAITVTYFINRFGFSTNLKFLIPISIASMLLTIFFDNRSAFMGTITLSIIIAAMRGNDFGMMIVSMFVGTMSMFAVREIQARNWILKGILYISGAYIVSIGATELLKHTEFEDLWDMWSYGIINGLLSPILAYGLMIIFEYVFQTTTNSTLLELSDLNKPLLRNLAIRAPGSYHHSIMVGNLSEAASEAIGANALLARVASYYHDIGKMDKPEYFVENQKAGRNPHEKLAPSMSCLILINHVKRGLEIAEKQNLPAEIRAFIPQHHGTNLIRYFYQKAIENAEDGEVVDEANFRYGGPTPQSKEAGIVMLADAVEAGSRAMKDPSISRVRSMIDSIIQERLLENELDECPLTIGDLKLIRESFVGTLAGMFHGRIEYPKQEDKSVQRNSKKGAEAQN